MSYKPCGVDSVGRVTPLRCAAAVIVDDLGRVFLQRRSPTRRLFPDTWDIVGGHLEPGESALDALGREITEETGWRLAEVLAVLAPVTYTGDDGHIRIEEDFVVRVDGDLANPRLEAGKHTAYRWITEDEVPDVLDGEPPSLARDLMRALLTDAFAELRRGN
jgi:8-oxo-dGTP diphosphatase